MGLSPNVKEVWSLCMLAQHLCMTCIAECTYLDGIIDFQLSSVLQSQSKALDGKCSGWWQTTVQADDPRDSRKGCDHLSEPRHLACSALRTEHAFDINSTNFLSPICAPLTHPLSLSSQNLYACAPL